jgi:hypothetical protein
MKSKVFIVVWILISAGIYYFWSLRNIETETPTAEIVKNEKPLEIAKTEETPLTIDSEKLPLKLKGRIDSVLSQIEDMWDPNGTKVKEIGERMDALEVALEENNPELAEKILSEMEVIISEK